MDFGEHSHDMSRKKHHPDCQCVRCEPLGRPCDCHHCRAFKVAQKLNVKDSQSIEDWRKELEYIMDMSVAGSEDWNNLKDFACDYDTFTTYVIQRADAAEEDDFPGIAREMRALTL